MDEKPAITRYFDAMREHGASDLHLKVGSPPAIRVHAELKPLTDEVLTEERIHELIGGVASSTQQETYERTGNLDFAYSTAEGRYRINVFRQRGHTSVAVRLVHRLREHSTLLKSLWIPMHPLV